MTDRPDAIRRLDRYYEAAMIAHEYVARLQRQLAQLGESSERSAELLRESASITLSRIPELTRSIVDDVQRWHEEELLDPSRAPETLATLEAAFLGIEPALIALRGRQDEIARELSDLIERAEGA